MGKSYKKYPFCKDRDSSKWGKRYCNKVVRKSKDIPSGKAYKKLVEPWDFIYDYSFSETWKEYQHWHKQWNYPGEPDYYEWYKTYKRK